MSQDVKAPAQPKLSLIQELRQQVAAFTQQREQAKIQFEQLQGAIFACEQIILKMEANAKEQLTELADKLKGQSGEQGNGETDEQDEEKAA